MSHKMLIIPIAIAVLIVMSILWILFIRPLFKFQRFASRNIRRATFSKLIDIDKNILTISSAAIILTVSLIQEELLSNIYLVASWASFLISISAGILLYIAYFVHDYTDEISIDKFHKFLNKQKNEKAEEGELDVIHSIRNNQRILVKTIFILIYFEITFLIIALILLSLFGYKNLLA